MCTFINLSNHPSATWSEEQLSAASKYGKIIDINFPNITPEMSDIEINLLVSLYFNDIINYNVPTVMVMGEYIFTFRLITLLKSHNIKVLSSCSIRISSEFSNPDGTITKKSIFKFAGFKEY